MEAWSNCRPDRSVLCGLIEFVELTTVHDKDGGRVWRTRTYSL
jgi:hypothetical protein